MTESDARKVWLALALILFLQYFGLYGLLQSADFVPKLSVEFGLVFKKDAPHPIIALWGILICALLTIAVNLLTHLHANAVGNTWKTRYPFRLLQADPDYGIGRVAQVIAFILFTLLPWVAIVHFWRTLLIGGTICQDGKPTGTDVLQLPKEWGWHQPWGNLYKLAGPDSNCAKSTTFEPVLQPAIWAFVTAIAFICLVRALLTIFRGSDATSPTAEAGASAKAK